MGMSYALQLAYDREVREHDSNDFVFIGTFNYLHYLWALHTVDVFGWFSLIKYIVTISMCLINTISSTYCLC